MNEKVKSVINKMLSFEQCAVIAKLGLASLHNEVLKEHDVYDAISALEDLASKNTDEAREAFITIAALLWEHGKSEFPGLRDYLTVLLARIGYGPSSIILDEDTKNVATSSYALSGLSSIMLQWETVFNQLHYSVQTPIGPCMLTEFQHKVWTAIDSERAIGISAPTSAGKSFVIALKSLELAIRGKFDIVYIVPTLSLVNQVSSDYAQLLSQAGIENFQLFNTCVAKEEIDVESENLHVYVLTQERAIAAYNDAGAYFDRPCILIIDEIQNIEHAADDPEGDRARILLDFIDEFRRQNIAERIVISGPRIEGIKQLTRILFQNNDAESFSTNVSPVLGITYAFRQEKSKVYLDQFCHSAKGRRSMELLGLSQIPGYGKRLYNDDYLEFASNLVERISDDAQTIVFSPSPRQAMNNADALAETVSVANNNASLASYLRRTVHPEYRLASLVEAGVAYHHGQMPMHVRKAIEVGLSQKRINKVACTTTLMQGVNLPSSNIVIRNPHLYTRKTTGHNAELSSYELANLRGRAGRLLKDFVGRTFVLDEEEFLSLEEYGQEELFEDSFKSLSPTYEDVFTMHRDAILDEACGTSIALKDDDAPQHLVVFIRQAALRYGSNVGEQLHNRGIDVSHEEANGILRALRQLALPADVCLRNRYMDPFALNDIYLDLDFPQLPLDLFGNNAQRQLIDVLEYLRSLPYMTAETNKRIGSENLHEKKIGVFCSKAISWAREEPLAAILGDWFHSQDPSRIEGTIRMLQGAISFGLPALLRPIYDAKFADSSILSFFESGAYHPVVRKMIDLGISREPALELYAKIARLNTSRNMTYSDLENSIRDNQDKIPYWTRIQIPFLVLKSEHRRAMVLEERLTEN